MNDFGAAQGNDGVQVRSRRPFRSIRFYVTLVFTSLLPVALWLFQDSVRAILDDFELDLSRLTQFFVKRQAVYLTLLLPKAVILKELLIGEDSLRRIIDMVLGSIGLCRFDVCCVGFDCAYDGVDQWAAGIEQFFPGKELSRPRSNPAINCHPLGQRGYDDMSFSEHAI